MKLYIQGSGFGGLKITWGAYLVDPGSVDQRCSPRFSNKTEQKQNHPRGCESGGLCKQYSKELTKQDT